MFTDCVCVVVVLIGLDLPHVLVALLALPFRRRTIISACKLKWAGEKWNEESG
jgi:hypothetical protein